MQKRFGRGENSAGIYSVWICSVWIRSVDRLGEDRCNEIAVDIRQSEVPALEAIGEFCVVDTEQVQDSGIEVVHVNGIFGDVVAIVIGFTVDSAFADSGTGQQSGKAPWVVIASVIVWGECTLGVYRATEFTAPDDEGIVEESALL